jgi:iron(III) transport system ATP-binding protein
LRLVCGFERADSGVGEIDGEVVSGLGVHVLPERRCIGYVALEGSLFPGVSAAATVLFCLPRCERYDSAKAVALLEGLGLPAAYASRAPHELSASSSALVRARAQTQIDVAGRALLLP